MTQDPAHEENKDQSKSDLTPTTETGPAFAAPEEPISDLSAEILKTLPRTTGERIT